MMSERKCSATALSLGRKRYTAPDTPGPELTEMGYGLVFTIRMNA